MRRTWILALMVMLALTGCVEETSEPANAPGDGFINDDPNDNPDDPNPEAPAEPDAPAEPEAVIPDASCDRDDFLVARKQTTVEQFGVQYLALNTTGTPYDMLMVQIYSDFGGPTEPGTFDLDGINYADCGLCVIAFSGCTGGNQRCDKTFYAEQGSVEITAIEGEGGQFAANLEGVVMEEVTIDSNTFRSTAVEGGESWCVGELAFDETIENLSGAACERPGINCVGDTVPDFSLQNCATGEMESLSEMTEGDKAAWIVLTAGWCPACRQWLPQVAQQDDASEGQGLEVIYVLGENTNYGQPTLEYCQQYADHYTDVDRFYIDHDGEYSFATLFGSMWPYIDDNGAFGLPWNAVIDPETMEYIYADGSNQGTLNGALQNLLAE